MQAVHDAEDLLERCKVHADEARKKLQQVTSGDHVVYTTYSVSTIFISTGTVEAEDEEEGVSGW